VGFGGEWPAERSDAELLAAHVAGDRYAFDELFHRHRRQLHRLARLTSRTAEDAEDALQDAMLSAHRGAGSFRYDAAVGSWLHRIVVNACLDRLRRAKAHPTAPLQDIYNAPPWSPSTCRGTRSPTPLRCWASPKAPSRADVPAPGFAWPGCSAS
jgi:RNA polymerase sigma-70 factor (ECF subfamily)